MKKTVEYFEKKYDEYISLLQSLVNIDSISQNIKGVDACFKVICDYVEKLGYMPKLVKLENGSNLMKIYIPGSLYKKKIVLLGHIDTVFPDGETALRPFNIQDGKAYGPGVSDMKSGVVAIMLILKAIKELNEFSLCPMEVFLNSDEECGSEYSKYFILETIKDAKEVLLFEPGRPNGDVVTGRKGIGQYTIRTKGISAHAGTNHQDGKNAIVEMAHKVISLSALTDYELGTTVNVGVINGGSASNVVPDDCCIQVDVRFSKMEEVGRIEASIKNIVKDSGIEGVITEATGGVNRPPMEQTDGNMRLYSIYKTIGEAIGYSVGSNYVGGGSDGNFTSAAGIATLDGLGPSGGGYHSDKEYIELESIVPRMATAYILIKELCKP